MLVAVALLAVGRGEPGRWGTPVKLAPANGRDWVHTSPHVAAGGNGQAMAVWHEPLDESGNRHRVRFSTYERDGWSAPEVIAETGQHSYSRLAMGATGEAVLGLWEWPGLSVLRFLPGQGWSESRRWSSGVLDVGGQVAIGDDGTAAVLWIDLSRPAILYASRFSKTMGWGSDDAISSGRPSTYYPEIGEASVTVDARGNALATWIEQDYDGYSYRYDSIWTSRAEKGSPWSTARRIDEHVDFGEVALAGNKDGEAILAWGRGDLYATLLRDGRWAAPGGAIPPVRRPSPSSRFGSAYHWLSAAVQ